MPKQVSPEELDVVLQAVSRFPEGASIEDIRVRWELRLRTEHCSAVWPRLLSRSG